jgi:hypothetical protein
MLSGPRKKYVKYDKQDRQGKATFNERSYTWSSLLWAYYYFFEFLISYKLFII